MSGSTCTDEGKHKHKRRTDEGRREAIKFTALATWMGKADKGRWTYRLIPHLDKWINRRHGSVNYYLTQMLSGHGCFRAYLYKHKYEDSPECPSAADSKRTRNVGSLDALGLTDIVVSWKRR